MALREGWYRLVERVGRIMPEPLSFPSALDRRGTFLEFRQRQEETVHTGFRPLGGKVAGNDMDNEAAFLPGIGFVADSFRLVRDSHRLYERPFEAAGRLLATCQSKRQASLMKSNSRKSLFALIAEKGGSIMQSSVVDQIHRGSPTESHRVD